MTELHLSPRQVEVCCLVAAGESDKQIAKELGIGIRTVHTHIDNAARRIKAANPWIANSLPRKVIRRYYVEFAGVAAFQQRREHRMAA